MAKKSGKTLSSNLLEMKFMKRSKENREKEEEQEEYREVFHSNIPDDQGRRVTYQPDIAQLENLVYPRRSYGGQNPAIEKLMAEKDGQTGGAADESMEADVTDAQMADHYSSVVGTIGKKFRTKRQRSRSQEQAGERTPSRPPVLKKVKQFLRPSDE
ncbi:M-phase phosphoprotein 6-like [Amphibalanus amphitrite]|uniref:M-phase phosphoprotein 6-like n=1 Tax=Amphibalanus amphitrite TaxID=1232801 RepID=UPI001C9089BF|nr:M-phase phosphoprotein 6-like [Amphibalanus amphitrite]